MAGRLTSLGFLHACTSQIISNETTFQGSIDENNTWISVKCLSRGSGLSGILFKNVKYSACLNPINQWYFAESFSSKKNENIPNVLIKCTFIFPFDMFWYLLFAKHSLITHMPRKNEFENLLLQTNSLSISQQSSLTSIYVIYWMHIFCIYI